MKKNELDIILEEMIKDDIYHYQEISFLKTLGATTKRGIRNLQSKFTGKDTKENIGLKKLKSIKIPNSNFSLLDKINLKALSQKDSLYQRNLINDLLKLFIINKNGKDHSLTININKFEKLRDNKRFRKLSFLNKVKVIESLMNKKIGNNNISVDPNVNLNKMDPTIFPTNFQESLKIFYQENSNQYLEKNYIYSEADGRGSEGVFGGAFTKILFYLLVVITATCLLYGGYLIFKKPSSIGPKLQNPTEQMDSSDLPENADTEPDKNTGDDEDPTPDTDKEQQATIEGITNSDNPFDIEVKKEKEELESSKKSKEGDLQTLKQTEASIKQQKDGPKPDPKFNELIVKFEKEISGIDEKISGLDDMLRDIKDIDSVIKLNPAESFETKAQLIRKQILEQLRKNQNKIKEDYTENVKKHKASKSLIKKLNDEGLLDDDDDSNLGILGLDQTATTLGDLQEVRNQSYGNAMKIVKLLIRFNSLNKKSGPFLNDWGLDNSSIANSGSDISLECFATESGKVSFLPNKLNSNGTCKIKTGNPIKLSAEAIKAVKGYQLNPDKETLQKLKKQAGELKLSVADLILTQKAMDYDNSTRIKKDQKDSKDNFVNVFNKLDDKIKKDLKTTYADLKAKLELNKKQNYGPNANEAAYDSFIKYSKEITGGNSPDKEDLKTGLPYLESNKNNRKWEDLLAILENNYL